MVLKKVFFIWEPSYVDSIFFDARAAFCVDAYYIFLQSCWPLFLDTGCDWCYGEQKLQWRLAGGYSLICGFHRPVRGKVCSPVVRIKPLRIKNQVLCNSVVLKCVVCPQGGESWSKEAHVVIVNPSPHPWRHLWFFPDCIPFSIVFIPNLGWCWGLGCYGCRNQGGCAAT